MEPTDTYQTRADALYEEWEYNPRKLREAIAEALAEAHAEGQVEGRNETRLAKKAAEEKMYAMEELRKKNYDAHLERERIENELPL